jgi:O-antigen/teichoic acid export membrane protein
MRQSRITTNFLLNVAGTIVPLATALITIPIYIAHIGAARYGILSVAWILLGYLGFLDLGLSRASINALSRLSHGSAAERAAVLVTALYMNLLLG